MENREERREEMREERRDERHEERMEKLPNQNAEDVLANGKRNHNHNTRKINRLWLWLGVLILIFILCWFLFGIGTAEDVSGVQNGTQGSIDMIMSLLRI